jgi:RNA polymerase sigma-70 factor (ECF subfamily)
MERRADEPAGSQHGSDAAVEELLARVEKGEAEAFDGIVSAYQNRVYNLLLRFCGSPEDAEDLTQETFIKAYRALKDFRRGSKFYTWLFRIAVNAAYSQKRRAVRKDRVEGVGLGNFRAGRNGGEPAGTDAGMPADAAMAEPAAEAEQREVHERVWRELALLEQEHRAVLLLRDVEGLDYEAAAETLGISRAAVKSRLYRARAALAQRLKDLRP